MTDPEDQRLDRGRWLEDEATERAAHGGGGVEDPVLGHPKLGFELA